MPVVDEAALIVAGTATNDQPVADGKRIVLRFLQAQWLDKRGFWRDFED